MVLMPLNSSMIAVALPVISHSLQVPFSQSAWLVSLYLIVMATVQPIAGRLGDVYGHRRLFLLGIALLFAASVGAAQSDRLPALIIMRSLQGLGGAVASPNAVALLRRAFRGPELPRRLGLMSMTQGLAAAMGPLIGAVVVARFGWSSIFWVSVPFAALSVVGVLVALPAGERPEPTARSALDPYGSGLLAAFLVLVTFAVGQSRLALVPLAAVALGLFLWRETRARNPVVSLALFRHRPFRAANAGVWVNNFGMYITLLWMPIFLRDHGIGLRTVGPLLFAFSFAMSMASWSSSRVARRFGRDRTVRAGFLLEAISLAIPTFLGLATPLDVLAFLVLAGIGVGLPTVSLQATSLESVPVEQAGMASGVYSTFRYMGSILASGLLVVLTGTISGYGISLAVVAAVGCVLSFGLSSGAGLPALQSSGVPKAPERTIPS